MIRTDTGRKHKVLLNSQIEVEGFTCPRRGRDAHVRIPSMTRTRRASLGTGLSEWCRVTLGLSPILALARCSPLCTVNTLTLKEMIRMLTPQLFFSFLSPLCAVVKKPRQVKPKKPAKPDPTSQRSTPHSRAIYTLLFLDNSLLFFPQINRSHLLTTACLSSLAHVVSRPMPALIAPHTHSHIYRLPNLATLVQLGLSPLDPIPFAGHATPLRSLPDHASPRTFQQFNATALLSTHP